jgi:hypothetical protein
LKYLIESLPICLICKKETLLPLSASEYELGGKTFGSWICSKCGFYLTTGDTRGVNPEIDIKIGFSFDLRRKISKMKEEYLKGNPK